MPTLKLPAAPCGFVPMRDREAVGAPSAHSIVAEAAVVTETVIVEAGTAVDAGVIVIAAGEIVIVEAGTAVDAVAGAIGVTGIGLHQSVAAITRNPRI